MTTDKQHNEFLTMLNKCHAIIMRVCLTHTDRTSEGIKELYQDIAYNLWRSYPQFRHESEPGTWVYRVALSTACMSHRTRRTQPQLINADISMYESIAEAADDDMLARLYELLRRLPDDEQELARLYLDDMPLRDIATTLGTTESAIKHRISNLKLKLKKMNEDED